MKIEIKTQAHTEWTFDIVSFEDHGDTVEIMHDNGSCSEIKKTELVKVLRILCADE
ncbi:hypothetical protein [Bacillus sp. FSL K6-3431]|uniref:hypothetical protein n=1 Tax=Bacillus sp. FSL K6-3431 TaxID=2921500 RepID=UPI0030FA85E4